MQIVDAAVQFYQDTLFVYPITPLRILTGLTCGTLALRRIIFEQTFPFVIPTALLAFRLVFPSLLPSSMEKSFLLWNLRLISLLLTWDFLHCLTFALLLRCSLRWRDHDSQLARNFERRWLRFGRLCSSHRKCKYHRNCRHLSIWHVSFTFISSPFSFLISPSRSSDGWNLPYSNFHFLSFASLRSIFGSCPRPGVCFEFALISFLQVR